MSDVHTAPSRILLTGATGFIGQRLYPALVAQGHEVVCASRDPERSRREQPRRQWVALDLDRGETIGPALAGCDSAYYLVHGMSEGGAYPERERRWAEAFREAARGLRRVVYLGGVAPRGEASEHLASRLATGAILRGGGAQAVELRAALIVGAGGSSWEMVRDLAVRLPVMVLPKWLRNRSSPVAIDDVVVALLAALTLPLEGSAWFDVPGAEVLTHEELLRQVAALCGTRPLMLRVPFVTPTLSSYWIALVTRTNPRLARELVQGLRTDLIPDPDGIWARVPGHRPLTFAEAARRALAEEEGPRSAAGLLFESLARAVAKTAPPKAPREPRAAPPARPAD